MSLFSKITEYIRANKIFIVSLFLVVAVTGFYFWWQHDFSLNIMKFFAFDRDGTGTGQNDTNPPPIGDVGGSTTCTPTFRSCSGSDVFEHYSDCNGSIVEVCANGCDPAANNTAAVCIQSNPTVPPGPDITPTPDATPTAAPTVTPTATPGGGSACVNLTSEKGGKVIINSKSGGGACMTVSPGSSQTNSSSLTNAYSFPVGHVTRVYHDPIANCDYSYGNEAGGTKDIHGWTTIEPGQTKSFSETITAACGRYQIDFNVYNVDAACTADPRSDQFEYHSAMLFNTGINCGATTTLTPTPTPTSTPSITPTPSVSVTPTPTPSIAPTPTPQSPKLSIAKLVRNVTQGSSQSDSVIANPLQTVEFSIAITSSGAGTVNAVTLRDALPSGLSYVVGSTTIDAIAATDGVVSTGLSIGNMAQGRTVTVRFYATIANASFFSSGTSSLTNTAFARGSNVSEVSDSAFISVMTAPPSLSISLTKMGKNITRGDTAESSPVRSSPSQTLSFVLRVRNTSSLPITDAVIRDILPQEVSLLRGSVAISGVSASDVIATTGIPLGVLAPGQEVVVTLSGVVTGAAMLPSGTTTIINAATITATGVPSLSAQLPIVIVNGGVVVPPVSTGPGETTVVALIISALVSLLYVGYAHSDAYRRREVTDIARRAQSEGEDFRS